MQTPLAWGFRHKDNMDAKDYIAVQNHQKAKQFLLLENLDVK